MFNICNSIFFTLSKNDLAYHVHFSFGFLYKFYHVLVYILKTSCGVFIEITSICGSRGASLLAQQ